MIQPKVSYFVILCIVIFIEITCKDAMMLQVKHSRNGSAIAILAEMRSTISIYEGSTKSLPTNDEFNKMMSVGIDLGKCGRIQLERDTLKKIKINSDGTGEILCGEAKNTLTGEVENRIRFRYIRYNNTSWDLRLDKNYKDLKGKNWSDY